MKTVSYSQYSMYKTCPLQWKLTYVDRAAPALPSIHYVFGLAMHDVIQEWLTVLFTRTKKEAQSMDLPEMLLNRMKHHYRQKMTDTESKEFFSSPEELTEFWVDGKEILLYLKRRATKWFSKRDWELIAVEKPLSIEVRNGVRFKGYIDIILKHKRTHKYKIIDLKTSTRGWGEKARKDKKRTAQILLYKKYYAEQYNISEDDIEVEFMILRRKLYEDSPYPIPRVSKFSPSHKKVSINKAMKDFTEFLNSVFDEGGNFITEGIKATPSKFGCMFCSFNTPRFCSRGLR